MVMFIDDSGNDIPETPDLNLTTLKGKTLRVIEPGTMGDCQQKPGRLTITVDANNVIVDIKVG